MLYWYTLLPTKYSDVMGNSEDPDQTGPIIKFKMNRDMRKPAICICQNKGADQLRGNHAADQRLCFRYINSQIPLLSKSESSSL